MVYLPTYLPTLKICLFSPVLRAPPVGGNTDGFEFPSVGKSSLVLSFHSSRDITVAVHNVAQAPGPWSQAIDLDVS